MQLMPRIALAAAVAALCLLAMTGDARAYPQLQMSSGSARCSLCHFAPAGGGLLNDWGRMEAADTLSRGGDGEFLYGAWEPPSFVQLGGDFRGVLGVKDADAAELDYLAFPMQADLYARFRLADAWSLAVTAGIRGAARNRDSSPASRFGSREHYLMYQPESTGLYVRAGKFFAPYGLRQVDHTMYARRFLGFYAWEETYNLSAGILESDWELHATAFAPDPYVQGGEGPYGGAAMYERRALDDTLAYGVQTKVELGDLSSRYIVGAVAKYYAESADLMLMAESDLALETFDADGADARTQWLGHLNATYFVTPGVWAGAVLERYDEDTSLSGTQRDAASLLLQYFPRAHWELMLMGRVERAGGGDQSRLGFLMLHYYL